MYALNYQPSRTTPTKASFVGPADHKRDYPRTAAPLSFLTAWQVFASPTTRFFATSCDFLWATISRTRARNAASLMAGRPLQNREVSHWGLILQDWRDFHTHQRYESVAEHRPGEHCDIESITNLLGLQEPPPPKRLASKAASTGMRAVVAPKMAQHRCGDSVLRQCHLALVRVPHAWSAHCLTRCRTCCV